MNKNKKKEPWRLIVGGIAVMYILYMWADKHILSLYASMPAEEALPVIVTTIAVTLAKVAWLTGILYAIKWFTKQRKDKK